MKKIFLLLLLLLAGIGNAQSHYEILWDSNENVKYWEVYVEIRQFNSGFVLQDGGNYKRIIEQFRVGKVDHKQGLIKVSFFIKLPANGKWVKVGIIANNDVRSIIGTSAVIKLSRRQVIKIDTSKLNF